ncbi:MAG: hypothetical protein ACRD2X_01725 [Vicinamibacteraceae bacterium]
MLRRHARCFLEKPDPRRQATKGIPLTKTRQARVGLQFFNLTNHFNSRDVQNNAGSPTLREFANSVDRQVRLKFVLLF